MILLPFTCFGFFAAIIFLKESSGEQPSWLNQTSIQVIGIVMETMVGMAVLALGSGLAAILSGSKRKRAGDRWYGHEHHCAGWLDRFYALTFLLELSTNQRRPVLPGKKGIRKCMVVFSLISLVAGLLYLMRGFIKRQETDHG